MPGAWDFNKLRAGWNRANGQFQFFYRAERITRSLDKERGHLQRGEVRGTQLLVPSGRM